MHLVYGERERLDRVGEGGYATEGSDLRASPPPSRIRVTILRLRALLVILLIVAFHGALWGAQPLLAIRHRPGAFLFAGALVLGIVAHELLHLLGFVWFGGAPWSAVHVELRRTTIAAHCAVPLPVRSYRAAVALPGVVLGFVPTVIGLASGAAWLTVYGAVMLGAAVGDVRVLWRLRGVSAGERIGSTKGGGHSADGSIRAS
jgi:hypothetical protein